VTLTQTAVHIWIWPSYWRWLLHLWPASWSSGQIFWLLIMRSRVRFPVLTWVFFLEGEDSHGDHGLGSSVELIKALLVLHIHISPSTSSGQRNFASWASQPQKSVTLRSQPGRETMKSIRHMWWHWQKKTFASFVPCIVIYWNFGNTSKLTIPQSVYFSDT
jgi:hypothetical protein